MFKHIGDSEKEMLLSELKKLRFLKNVITSNDLLVKIKALREKVNYPNDKYFEPITLKKDERELIEDYFLCYDSNFIQEDKEISGCGFLEDMMVLYNADYIGVEFYKYQLMFVPDKFYGEIPFEEEVEVDFCIELLEKHISEFTIFTSDCISLAYYEKNEYELKEYAKVLNISNIECSVNEDGEFESPESFFWIINIPLNYKPEEKENVKEIAEALVRYNGDLYGCEYKESFLSIDGNSAVISFNDTSYFATDFFWDNIRKLKKYTLNNKEVVGQIA